MGTILMRIWPIEVYKNIKVFGNKGLLIGEKKRKREKKKVDICIYIEFCVACVILDGIQKKRKKK